MYQKIINTIVKLRRDNDYNYEKVKDTFIPLRGEMCIVDDSKYGVRAKVGDGTSTFGSLPFEDSYAFDRVVERGYLINGEFYFTNDQSSEILPHVDFKLYLDKLTGFDVVFKTPSMRIDNKALVKAKEEGAYITSEMEEFVRYCKGKIYGVTGSDGKTTTTTIISKSSKVWLTNESKQLFKYLSVL